MPIGIYLRIEFLVLKNVASINPQLWYNNALQVALWRTLGARTCVSMS